LNIAKGETKFVDMASFGGNIGDSASSILATNKNSNKFIALGINWETIKSLV
jgi:hypothetical protein